MERADSDRRPLATRSARWAQALAATLARWRVAPNAISVVGIGVAAAGGAAFYGAGGAEAGSARTLALVGAAAAIQLRLLCNMLDGLVAVEGGLRTKTGDVFNDLPDRIEDLFLIVGAGYAAREARFGVELGWLTASLALVAAYVRVLGKSVGAGTHFLGPMAKQHRMAALTAVALASAICARFAPTAQVDVLVYGLGAIAVFTTVTIARRTHRILSILEAR